MGSHVYLNVISLRTSVVALIAFETLFTTMRKNVPLEFVSLGTFVAALVALEWLLSTVS